jgi:hypothetical protein
MISSRTLVRSRKRTAPPPVPTLRQNHRLLSVKL